MTSAGGWVRSQRKRLGMSVLDAAAKAGIDRSIIGHLELGDVPFTLPYVARIADALGVPREELVVRAVYDFAPPERGTSRPHRPEPAVPGEDALRAAERAATDMQISPDRYRIGDVTDGAWCLVPDGDGWAVFWTQDGRRTDVATFPAAEEAVGYFVGRLYLHRDALREEMPEAQSPIADRTIQYPGRVPRPIQPASPRARNELAAPQPPAFQHRDFAPKGTQGHRKLIEQRGPADVAGPDASIRRRRLDG
ncbi:helix-turn-helix transcriptional regulator [Amycolatopsis sp. NEAU-NG30]|uniref:Helix-turn-helix transcriptional regulator n=1 Tax=Amycolatopsis melonis TaxID=3156488 RepID=A0ABV0LEM2_9PSEU